MLNTARIIDEEAIYYHRLAGTLTRPLESPKLIDLFSGAGGLTLGFTSKFGHFYEPVWANDFNQYAARTYVENFGAHGTSDDIVELIKERRSTIPAADVVVGGPPCQGFSLLNKKKRFDPRKQLWSPFLEVVSISGASIFLMENVQQLLSSSEHQLIIDKSAEMGFRTVSAKLCAADYGVPQLRWRAFVLGCNFADPALVFPPKKTHARTDGVQLGLASQTILDNVIETKPWETVRNAIGDLPFPLGTEIRDCEPPLDLHFGRNPTEKSIRRYKAIPDEGMNRFDLQKRAPELTPACWIRKKTGGTDLFGRMWWDKPSFTIRTEFFKPEKGRYLHPEQNRPITHREAARLQTFPDDFKFSGSKIEIAKQIGNAVPPLLSSRLADSVYSLLEMKSRLPK